MMMIIDGKKKWESSLKESSMDKVRGETLLWFIVWAILFFY
jgi:hypothetical protein